MGRAAVRTVAVMILAVILAGCGTGTSATTWTATVTGFSAASPADLSVTVRVTNTGATAGTPSCTIQAHDASYAYTGIDVVGLQQPVPAGAFRFFTDDVAITGQGAQYVTQVKVSCS